MDTTHALIQTAAAESEEKSEALTESFLDGSMDLDSFIGDYVPLRVTAHLRKLKADKMGELANAHRTRPTFSSGVPYPTNNHSMMPQPGLPHM